MSKRRLGTDLKRIPKWAQAPHRPKPTPPKGVNPWTLSLYRASTVQAEERWAEPDPEVVLETGTTVELVFQVILPEQYSPDPTPTPTPTPNPNEVRYHVDLNALIALRGNPNPHPNRKTLSLTLSLKP